MKWQEYFMRHAYLAASKSYDERTKIGAVLVRDNRIIASGYNGFPQLVKDLPERYNDPELKSQFIIHAEVNSILQCALLGLSSKDSTLYTFGVPCSNCTGLIIQAGVKKIVVHKQWPNLTYSEKWVKSLEFADIKIKEAKIEVEWFDGELGLIGRLDGKDIKI